MNREEALRYLLQRAGETGIDLEVLADESRELTIDSFDGNVSDFKQAIRGGVGVRAVVEGRVGYAWTEDLDREALDWVLEEARENALLQEESDGDGFLPEGEGSGQSDLLSEGLSAPLQEKVEQALGLERELKKDERYSRTVSARYTEREVRHSVASSKGVDGGYRDGFAGLFAAFVMRDGDSVKQGYGLDAAKEFHELDPGRTAQEFLRRTGRLLGARPLKTGRYRAYLEPPVVADLLGVLEFSLSGKTLVEGKSRFDGKLGERVASELVTLVDDPDHPEGLGSRPFDSEGMAARRLPLIEQGVLRSFLHNSYTARKSGQPNTGHAARNYRGTLGISHSNLLLLPGEGVATNDGVVVCELMGLHAGANPISGDISLQALGLRVEGGESYPVENFVISGNLFRMLEKVTAVGSEPEWSPGGSIRSPMIEIESLSFGGA
ncbi:MAG TPA: metallopeptidase TldD-related protein [Trueperaceae bacterium]